MKRHKWTPEHDDALWAAVEQCESLFGESNAWDAVAGRLLPDVHVTGSAACSRWHTLVAQRRDAEAEVLEVVSGTPDDLARDKWEDVIHTVGEIKKTTQEV